MVQFTRQERAEYEYIMREIARDAADKEKDMREKESRVQEDLERKTADFQEERRAKESQMQEDLIKRRTAMAEMEKAHVGKMLQIIEKRLNFARGAMDLPTLQDLRNEVGHELDALIIQDAGHRFMRSRLKIQARTLEPVPGIGAPMKYVVYWEESRLRSSLDLDKTLAVMRQAGREKSGSKNSVIIFLFIIVKNILMFYIYFYHQS